MNRASTSSSGVRSRRADKSASIAVRPVALPELIQRYLNGESVQVLAAESSVHRDTIYTWMLAGVGDKAYYDIVTRALVKRIADSDHLLATAKEPHEISRAREMCRFARMDFERRRPALYGAKQFNVNVGEVTVNAGLVGRAGELLRLIASPEAALTLDEPEEAESTG
jgi:hypothetical protein